MNNLKAAYIAQMFDGRDQNKSYYYALINLGSSRLSKLSKGIGVDSQKIFGLIRNISSISFVRLVVLVLLTMNTCNCDTMILSSCLGEIQAMNTFATDLLSSDQDYEHAAEVLTQAIIDLPTLSSDHRPISEQPQQVDPQQEVYFFGTLIAPEESYDEDDESIHCPSKTGHKDSHRCKFVRSPAMFECVSCNEWYSQAAPNSPPRRSTNCCSYNAWVSPQRYYTASIVCMYNLALCHHLQWWDERVNGQRQEADSHQEHNHDPNLPSLYNSERSLHHLKKALGLYEQAFGVTLQAIATTKTTCTAETNHPIWDVILAILANAAHCAMELSQLSQVHLLNSRLRRALDFTRPKANQFLPHLETTEPRLRNQEQVGVVLQEVDGEDANMEEQPKHSHQGDDIGMTKQQDHNDEENDYLDEDDYQLEGTHHQSCTEFERDEYRAFLYRCEMNYRHCGTGAPSA